MKYIKLFEEFNEDLGFDPNENGNLFLPNLTELPFAVNFTNNGYVWLGGLKTIPAGTKFNNKGYVSLDNLTELPEGIEFNNKGDIGLNNIKTIPKGFKFNNTGDIYMNKYGGWIDFNSKYNYLKFDLDMFLACWNKIDILNKAKYINDKKLNINIGKLYSEIISSKESSFYLNEIKTNYPELYDKFKEFMIHDPEEILSLKDQDEMGL